MVDVERYRRDEISPYERDLDLQRRVPRRNWSVWPGLLLALAIVAIALIGHAVIHTYFEGSAVTSRPLQSRAANPAASEQPRRTVRGRRPRIESAGLVDSESANYVGNTNTGHFHRSDCHYSTCPNCTAYFRTRDDAVASGFQPAGCCNP